MRAMERKGKRKERRRRARETRIQIRSEEEYANIISS
jgi:hypothetical protein